MPVAHKVAIVTGASSGIGPKLPQSKLAGEGMAVRRPGRHQARRTGHRRGFWAHRRRRRGPDRGRRTATVVQAALSRVGASTI